MPACRKNVEFVFPIVEGSRLGYIQRGFEQRDFIGTGTTSDADWACQGDEKNVHFFQIVEGELPAWVHPESL